MLSRVLELGMPAFAAQLHTIVLSAIQEHALEQMLENQVVQRWEAVELAVVLHHKDSQRDVFKLGSFDAVVELVDDTLVTVHNLLSSR